jgi:L-alanine-DL-glutamate epimerase-like enolase superfamily enzyme
VVLTPIRQASLLKLTTDDGVEGIGEAWGPPSITKAYLDLIAPYFIGREVYGFEHATSAILSTYYHFGIQNQMTSYLSGIDIACLDAIGKMLGLPIVKLLGGPVRDRLPIPSIASRLGKWSRTGGGLPFRRVAARLSAQPQHRAAAAN